MFIKKSEKKKIEEQKTEIGKFLSAFFFRCWLRNNLPGKTKTTRREK